MKNYTTRYFCMRFCACEDGTAWALKYADMRTCYAALLAGKAGGYSTSWAIWVATRNGVMSDRNLRLFAVRCARRVQRLMNDERSIAALDVAERYVLGQATDKELTAAKAAARASAEAAVDAALAASYHASYHAANFAANFAARYAAIYAAEAVASDARKAARGASRAAAYAAWEAERMAQLKLLVEFGNPFEIYEDAKV